MASSDPPWSDLPHHILGLFIDRLQSSPVPAAGSAYSQLLPRELPDDDDDRASFRAAYRSHHMEAALDRARFRAVCRSWRSAVREHLPLPPSRRLPWAVISDGSFMTGSDTSCRRLPSWPKNATCIGCTDDWLTLQCALDDDGEKTTHTYVLHNPFSGATVRLPELDTVIGHSSRLFKVRKVLMRSTPSDVVAIITNNYNYPIILVRPGKGVWLPRPRAAPFVYIIDIAFVGDKLYGITVTEDLISLDIAFDAGGKPNVARTKRVIRHATKRGDLSNVWSDVDYTRVLTYISPLDDGHDLWSDVDEKYCEDDDDVETEDEEEDDTLHAKDDDNCARYEIRKNTGDDTILEAINLDESNDFVSGTSTWHITESLGKLLMVRQNLHWPCSVTNHCYTDSADVFEADITQGVWMPITAGLDGQAIFISRYNCKSVHACGEVEKDAIYFVHTGDVLSMKSHMITIGQHRDLHYGTSMWIFPPEIVV